MSGYQCFIWTIAFCLSVRKVRNVHCNVLTGVRVHEAMSCNVSHWRLTLSRSDLRSPNIDQSCHYWFQMLDDHCHIHEVIVNLALQRQRRQPKKIPLHYKVNFTILQDQRNVRVQCTLVGKTCYILTFNFHPSTPDPRQETAWICDTFSGSASVQSLACPWIASSLRCENNAILSYWIWHQ